MRPRGLPDYRISHWFYSYFHFAVRSKKIIIAKNITPANIIISIIILITINGVGGRI